MNLDDLSNLKSNKMFLITILIIGIIGLGYVGINLYTASVVPVADTGISYLTIPAYKQDGSRNMEVIVGEPHTLETKWTSPSVGYMTAPPIGYWFFIVNVITGESYRSPNIPYGTSTYHNIEIANISQLNEWSLIYWIDGTNNDVEQYNGIIEGTRFTPFTAYNISREDDYCDGTTFYYDGVYYLGEVTFDIELNSPTCGWEPDPCIEVICQDYCVGTSLYTSGICSDGICNYTTEFNSPVCGYIEPTATPVDNETSTPDDNETSVFDTIIDLFTDAPEPTPTPVPVPSSSSSSEPTTSPTAIPESITTIPEEESNLITDFIQWVKDIINDIGEHND